jgi:hypothetical protein
MLARQRGLNQGLEVFGRRLLTKERIVHPFPPDGQGCNSYS